jgi:hypothetical protein
MHPLIHLVSLALALAAPVFHAIAPHVAGHIHVMLATAPVLSLTVQGQNYAEFDVTTAADADTGASNAVAHNILGVVTGSGANLFPGAEVSVCPLTAAGALAQYSAVLSATTLTVTKNATGAGSGGSNQCKFVVKLLHSLIK